MTKKLVIALLATGLLTVGACTKTSDESGAPVIQPDQETAPAAQPIDPYSPQNQQQPGASPSPNSNYLNPNY